MGILDDAIREHLDLKRRLGAEDTELARLEGEAFGPPSRPGEPDFPDEDAEAAPPDEEPVTGEAPAEAPAAAEAPSDELAEAPAAASAPAEPEGEAAGFYDHQSDELELDQGPPDAEAPVDEPPSEELEAAPDTADQPAEPPAAAQPPIESLDTVEHHFEGAIEDTGEAEVVEGELADEPADGDDAGTEGEDEDVLEETPEFLRDAPEDDELWFEQGEPKDFDF